jgi:hypothetical protein
MHRGPKTKSKRTEEIEKRIVDIRFKDPEMEKVVFDKWFSVGSLLEYLDKKMS